MTCWRLGALGGLAIGLRACHGWRHGSAPLHAFRLARVVVTISIGEIPPFSDFRSQMATTDLDLGRYQLGWSDAEDYVFKPKKGLNESIVPEMSEMKNGPQCMGDFRARAQKHFEQKPMAPWFATQMPNLDFDDIFYYIKPTGGQVDKWEDLPDAIKNTYEKLGIPEAERKYLSGVTAQYESEVVFHRNR